MKNERDRVLNIESGMPENMPRTLVFCVSAGSAEQCRDELAACRAQITQEGLNMRVLLHEDDELPETPEYSSLYIADAGGLCSRIRQAGGAVCGYLHEENAQDRFEGTAYLLARPDQLDLDAFRKIYQRLRGLPWTIAVTPRCIIREMKTDDLDAICRLYEDEDARRFLTPPGPDREEQVQLLAAYIEKVYGLYGYGYWIVEDRADRRVIGRMGFGLPGQDSACPDFGYLIDRQYRRKGYAYEAALAALSYMKENLDISEIEAHTDPKNTASAALLQKLGFHIKSHEAGRLVYTRTL